MSTKPGQLEPEKRVAPRLSEQIAALEDSRPMKTWEREATNAFFDSLFESPESAATHAMDGSSLDTQCKDPNF